MKKQTVVLVWSAIFLLLVVAGCIGAYYIWGEPQGQTKDVTTIAFNCISTDIEAYTVTDKDSHYTIEYSQDGWNVKDTANAELDREKVDKLISSVSNITATGTVSRRDFEKLYTKDEKRIRLNLKDNKSVEIKIMGVYDGLCAFKVSGDRKIYVMNASMQSILVPKLDALRVTAVFTGLLNTDTLPDFYSYKDYDGSTLEIRTQNSSELAKGKGNRYIMESPYRAEVDDESFEQTIALKIPLLTVKQFVKNASSDFADYGLDKDSRAELSFKWNGVDETLYLGKTENGVVYAAKAESDEVFAIETGMLGFLNQDPFYVLESHILKSTADKIVAVDMVVGDAVYTVSSKDRNGSNPVFSVGDLPATRDVFEGVVDKLSDIEFVCESNETVKAAADVMVVIRYDNGLSEQKISFVKTNNNYAVFMGEKAEFMVDLESVDNFVREVESAFSNPMRID